MMEKYLAAGLFLALSVAFAYILAKRTIATLRAGRTPFSEKLLRPPGESLRLKIDEMMDDLSEKVVFICLALLAPSFAILFCREEVLQTNLGRVLLYGVFPLAVLLFVAFRFRSLRDLIKSIRNHRLGFEGERYVGTELNLLMREGGSVYHDFVFSMKPGGSSTDFNIDHIVVGSQGIFAIETKTRRKPLEDTGGKNFEVVFDGDSITFPGGFRDTSAIEQARRNAKDLSEWLTGSSEAPVPVIPVVVLPGWWITRKAKSDVFVLSGKNLAKTLSKFRSSSLPGHRLRSIADRIEAHCRDIDVQ